MLMMIQNIPSPGDSAGGAGTEEHAGAGPNKMCRDPQWGTSSRGGCRHSSWILVPPPGPHTAPCPEEWSSTGHTDPASLPPFNFRLI